MWIGGFGGRSGEAMGSDACLALKLEIGDVELLRVKVESFNMVLET